jgi:erythrin-vacuolar iron transport family protein
MPPIVNSGPLKAVQPGSSQPHRAFRDAGASSEAPAICRVSFVGPDQQWYSIKIAPSASASSAALPPVRQASYPVQTPPPALSRSWQAPPTLAPEPEWHDPYDQLASARSDRASALAEEWNAVSEPAKSESEGSSKEFILQIVQPGLTGLMDGSVSTLAPIFSVAFATHQPFTAFLVGLSSALGAGISMTFSEALSDDGELTGRGKPFLRGGVTGLMTFLSGVGHALPFLIPNLHLALLSAYIVVAIELVAIAAVRHKFFGTSWWLSIVQVVGGGALVFVVALLLGNA